MPDAGLGEECRVEGNSGNMRGFMYYHIIAFFLGFLLDLVLGDPYWMPHPVRLIGKLITGTEKRLHRKKAGYCKNGKADMAAAEFLRGIGLVLAVSVCALCGNDGRVSDDVSDSGGEMSESREYESLPVFKGRQSGAGQKGSFHDRRKGYGVSG